MKLTLAILALLVAGCQQENVEVDDLKVKCERVLEGEYEVKDTSCKNSTDSMLSVDFEAKTVRCAVISLKCEIEYE